MKAFYAIISMPLIFTMLSFLSVGIRENAQFWAYMSQERPDTDLKIKNNFFYAITLICSILISLCFVIDSTFFGFCVYVFFVSG